MNTKFKIGLYVLFACVAMRTETRVHVFGDSHAYFCFSNAMIKGDFNEHSVFCSKNGNCVEVCIHYLGPTTMYRIGRDGVSILNINGIVQEGDIVVFVFGEIDVRCHIGKQRDMKGRGLGEIIDVLTKKYIDAVMSNVCQYKNLNVVIVSPVPPRDPASELISLPMHGSLADRVGINNALCDALADACFAQNYYFLDIRPYFSDSDGSLNFELSDGNVHVGLPHNRIIKEALFALIKM